jgi:hypothetical protein
MTADRLVRGGKMRSRFVVAWIGAAALLGSGCIIVDGRGPAPRAVAHVPGPPPHAPAHGHRHKHHGRDLVYDSALGVYVVVGVPNLWFFDGHYVRWYGERWEIGVEIEGPWRVATINRVPAGLRDKRHPHGGPPGQQKKQAKH